MLAPNPFCEDHPGGVPEPCSACQNARLRNALKSQVRELGECTSSFSSAGWAFVGIAVTAITSLIAWAPAFAAMSVDLRVEFGWVWTVLVATLAVGVTVSVGLFVADRKIQAGRTASVKSVLAEMDLLADA